MKQIYLMAGKRFQTDGEVTSLNSALTQYGLVTNLDFNFWEGDRSVRRLADSRGTVRYKLLASYGDDVGLNDVCIGKVISGTGYEHPDYSPVAEVDLAKLEKILNEVREDIPDATFLMFLNDI